MLCSGYFLVVPLQDFLCFFFFPFGNSIVWFSSVSFVDGDMASQWQKA